MKENKKVLLGMSGGVDSSVAAILLKEKGYEVIGVTMILWNNKNSKDSIKDAKKVCNMLGIRHYTINLEEKFKTKVVDDFIEKYLDAKTPNPCIECNKYLKFGAMYEEAKKLGIDYIATGHYARVEFSKEYGRYVLKKSSAKSKDQSYVLYNIKKEILGHVIFPLESFESKEKIRQIAKEHGLEVANKKDSVDICFIPDNDYIKFLKENIKEKQKLIKSGNIVDVNKNIRGKHTGLVNYTIGQRKGLGIQNEKPLYVIKLDKEKNQVVVGEKESTYSKEAYINDVNLLLYDKIDEKIRVKAKIRYAAKEADATVYATQDENVLRVVFDIPQMAITPGQAIVFYVDDIVVGGGKIM